jgi:uncharacterized protein YndB with AHSA1/START domain
MPTPQVQQDFANSRIVITAGFDASLEQVWTLWSDPRRLEKWWGPPGYPATVEVHELVPDGRVSYFMTGPDGQRYSGAWRVESVNAPAHLVVVDEFVDDEGRVLTDLPQTRMTVEIVASADGTAMALTSSFQDPESMQQIIDMGAIEGMVAAMSQIEDVLNRSD